MIVVRNRPEVRWLPSRFRFAVFRLYALLHLGKTKRTFAPADQMMVLVVDSEQSFDQYVVGAWIFGTTTAYLAALIPLHPVIALPVAAIGAPLLLQVPLLILFGLIFPRWRNNQRAGTIILMSVLTIASVAYARSGSWVRFVAWSFLGALALNTIAALAIRILRQRIARIEREYFQP